MCETGEALDIVEATVVLAAHPSLRLLRALYERKPPDRLAGGKYLPPTEQLDGGAERGGDVGALLRQLAAESAALLELS